MKPMVLCLTREVLESQGIPYAYDGKRIFNFDLIKVPQDAYHFINRNIVDHKEDINFHHIGFHLPQVLPYITISDGKGKYLSYSRNGTETRLHGSRSIGIGGHIDITDITNDNECSKINFLLTIRNSAVRELNEEVNYPLQGWRGTIPEFNKIIIDTSNPVGRVHVGLYTNLVFPDAKPQEELHDPQWVTVDELKQAIDLYENWSQLIIEEL